MIFAHGADRLGERSNWGVPCSHGWNTAEKIYIKTCKESKAVSMDG